MLRTAASVTNRTAPSAISAEPAASCTRRLLGLSRRRAAEATMCSRSLRLFATIVAIRRFKRDRARRVKGVADAPDGLDVGRSRWVTLYLLAQRADMHVHRPAVAQVIIPPDAAKQL